MCKIQDRDTNEVLFCGNRKNNIYIVNTIELDDSRIIYPSGIDDQTNLWHRRVRHLNMKLLKYLESHELGSGLLKLSNKPPPPCGSCQQGKQKIVSQN